MSDISLAQVRNNFGSKFYKPYFITSTTVNEIAPMCSVCACFINIT